MLGFLCLLMRRIALGPKPVSLGQYGSSWALRSSQQSGEPCLDMCSIESFWSARYPPLAAPAQELYVLSGCFSLSEGLQHARDAATAMSHNSHAVDLLIGLTPSLKTEIMSNPCT